MIILIEKVNISNINNMKKLFFIKKTIIFFLDFNSMNKINPIQHHNPTNENNFIGSLTNYMLPSQGMLPMVSTKNMDVHCSHYIMPNTPVDYTAPNLNIWDSSQISSNMTNGISNTKKVI